MRTVVIRFSTPDSASGCQLGDPAAPLFFRFVLQPLLLRLEAKLVVAYLNDLTLFDPDPEVLLADPLIYADKCKVLHKGFSPGDEPRWSSELLDSRE